MNIISELESWYSQQCDSTWEHQYGISIGTLDNPGWSVRICLSETPYSDLSLEPVLVERTDDDWVHYKIDSGVFCANGGPKNLGEMLEYFINLCKAQR
jgi:hypothetical protein